MSNHRPSNATGRTILVIDDDANIRESISIMLEDHGYKVITANDGIMGYTRALREHPDLIICDMMMPRASGFIVVERLKHEHHLSTPIIMLTGNDFEAQRSYAEFLGIDRYLAKPANTAQIMSVVQELCPPFILETTSAS